MTSSERNSGPKESEVVGSILHGAYGDYYEQMIALRFFKRNHPHVRLILFFANDLRMKELEVIDLSFADEVHPRAAIVEIPVDRFLQFQVFDPELVSEVLAHLPESILRKIDRRRVVKPWSHVRRVWKADPAICDLGLSEIGRSRLPECERQNGIDPMLFQNKFTVGFLWRYRSGGGYISEKGQRTQEELIRHRNDTFRYLTDQFDAHVLVCGMGVKTTDANRERTDNKYTSLALDLPAGNVTYLSGLSWGLELETIRKCSLCIMMASGFSEALWMKRRGRGVMLLDAPRQYIIKLLWNYMPFFNLLNPHDLFFQLWQPHSKDRVVRYLQRNALLPFDSEERAGALQLYHDRISKEN